MMGYHSDKQTKTCDTALFRFQNNYCFTKQILCDRLKYPVIDEVDVIDDDVIYEFD
jgi:hypothetical protein